MGSAGLVLAAQISLGAGLGGIQPLGWPHPSKHTGTQMNPSLFICPD